ncbi:MAG: GNAT family N-acetyltransferase [Chitinophagaceae bacterium]|nr:GNAT family N-acetyltransferase [Chitinophagaceae bacterium]
MIDFNYDYQLENDVALLRPIANSDIDYLLPYALQEPELWKFSSISAAGADGMQLYIEQATNARQQQKEYAFIVYDKRSEMYAGSTRFYDIQNENQTLQLGYTWYGKAYQGTGLNKNCKLLLLSLAFDELEFERVEFRADHLNEKSVAAMKSIGCKVEGILRSNMPKATGGRRDSIVLSILKQEWQNGLKEALEHKLNERKSSL